MYHMSSQKQRAGFFKNLLLAPFIYLVFISLIVLDTFIELYHRICFPLYSIPLVVRRLYIRVDRHKLKYLTPLQKINCMYCGYANGLLAYTKEIANRTESYWCSVQHAHDDTLLSVDHQKDFLAYGDEEAYLAMSKSSETESSK